MKSLFLRRISLRGKLKMLQYNVDFMPLFVLFKGANNSEVARKRVKISAL